MMGWLLVGLVLVAYVVAVVYRINKSIEDYNKSLETNGSKSSQSSKQDEIYAPCIGCL
jgi:hypothetical protein